MAEIVLGLGSSHTPMLSTPAEMWADRLPGDRALYADRWDQLVAKRGGSLAAQLEPDCWRERHGRVQRAIDALGETLRAAAVDVVVVVGDDQEEVFPPGTLPPFAVWCLDDARNDRPDASTMPDFRAASLWAYFADEPTTYPCRADIARHLQEHLATGGFDVATVDREPPGRHLGHAFTFVQRRVAREPAIPMVPVLLNTFFPRSQPSVHRCDRFGTGLAEAILAWEGPERVAVVASGGLSHQVVDEGFDRRLLAALASPSTEALGAFSDDEFVDGDRPCGTGESKNWVVVAAVCRRIGLRMDVVAYEPLYRTEAGTGVGAAFARWLPP